MTLTKLSAFIACGLVVGATVGVAALNFTINNNVSKSFLNKSLVDDWPERSDGIESIDVDYSRSSIRLNIRTKRDMTCKDIYKALGLTTFAIKDKTFSPECTQIDKRTLRILYIEDSYT